MVTSRPSGRKTGTAVALGLSVQASAAAPSVVPAAEADEFTDLRAKWRALLLGEGFSPTAEPFKSRLAELGGTARQLRPSMAQPGEDRVPEPGVARQPRALPAVRLLGMLFALPAGSSWQVTDANRQIVFDAVEKAWASFSASVPAVRRGGLGAGPLRLLGERGEEAAPRCARWPPPGSTPRT